MSMDKSSLSSNHRNSRGFEPSTPRCGVSVFVIGDEGSNLAEK
jgi:hypothetical protein